MKKIESFVVQSVRGLALKKSIPFSQVATEAKISRPMMYQFMSGARQPSESDDKKLRQWYNKTSGRGTLLPAEPEVQAVVPVKSEQSATSDLITLIQLMACLKTNDIATAKKMVSKMSADTLVRWSKEMLQ